jgi:hypothetical protein
MTRHLPSPARRRSARLGGFAVASTVAGLALAACGASVTPGVASLGTTTTMAPVTGNGSGSTGSNYADAVRFSQCMRAKGAVNFPDPDSQGHFQISASSDASKSVIESAQRACQHLLPNGGHPSAAQQAQMQARALKNSQCMRRHGVANFPDPQFGPGGRISMSINVKSGIDPNSPTFQNAQKACRGILGGAKGGPKGG